jgi:catechol 1,2-dioxygenase
VLAFREGFKTHISQVYVDDTDILDTDVQFGVTEALVGRLEPHDEPHPTDGDIGRWYSLDFTFTMERGRARLPLPPIK